MMRVEVLAKDGGVTYFPYVSDRFIDIDADELVVIVPVGHLNHETRFALDKVAMWHVDFSPDDDDA